MTTLPATIPGLVRRGSPCLYHGQRVHSCLLLSPKFQESDCIISFLRRDGSAETSYAPPEDLSLDLTDPTGRVHALLYLAEKLGMDARYGLLWCRVPHVDFMPAYYILAGATPGPDGATLSSWRWVFTEADHDAERYFGKDPEDPGFGPNGYTTVPNILSAGDTEALRLAVLAVAGVEG